MCVKTRAGLYSGVLFCETCDCRRIRGRISLQRTGILEKERYRRWHGTVYNHSYAKIMAVGNKILKFLITSQTAVHFFVICSFVTMPDHDNWGGYNLLVKLNQRNPEVQNYIFDVIRFWVSEFDIDGIRLDAADVLDFDFMKAMRGVASPSVSSE